MTMSLFNRAFDDILRLQHALDRAFGQPFHGFDAPSGRGVYPGLNVFESGDAILVKAEVPGLSREQLGVEVEGNRLVLTGSRVAPTATYRDGVLTVRLEKAETARPRQIAVQG
jgi:HSP20 family protein